MVLCDRTSRERENHSSGLRSDNCRELGGLKSTPGVGADEVDADISTYVGGNKYISHRWLHRVDIGRTLLENNVSETWSLGERLICLFDDIDVPGLGKRDSVYGGWELEHDRTRGGDPWAKDPKTSSI